MALSTLEITLDMSISGLDPDVETGLPLIMGTSRLGTEGMLYSADKYGGFKGTLGSGPLVDALTEHFLVYGGSTPYALALPLPQLDSGTVGTPAAVVTGDAVANFGAACQMNAEVYIECVKGGATGVAKVNISLDGGESWRVANKTVTDSVDIGIPDAGLTCSFDFNEGTMDLGDNWTVKLSQPAVSLTAVMTAIQAVHDLGYRPEYIVLTFPVDLTDCQTLHAYALTRWASNDPVWFIDQYAEPASRSTDDIQTWVNNFTAEFDGWASVYNLVVTGYARVADASGEKRWRMVPGTASGIVSTAQVHQSIGARNKFSMSHLTLPEAYLEGHANDLSNARGTVLMYRPQSKVVVFDKGLTLADEGTIYRRLEVIRTAAKMVKLCESGAEPYIEDEAWTGATGPASSDAGGITKLVKAIKDELDQMVKAKPSAELMGYQIEVPEGQAIDGPDGLQILVDGKLKPNLGNIKIGLSVGYGTLTTTLITAG